MSEPVDLSIVIVNWNARPWLERCLDAVFAEIGQAPFRTEVILVDNASSDDSCAMARDRFPRVKLIENAKNVGFAAANNRGIGEAAGCFILLLNPDTEVGPGALATLLQYMIEHEDLGAAGPRLTGSTQELERSVTRFPTLFGEMLRLFHLEALGAPYRMESWDQAEPRRVDVVQGACMLLRGEALQHVGLLDEDYFMYSEEVDLCHRLNQAGWSTAWVPEARVVHHGGQSTRLIPRTMFLELYRSKVLFFRKRRGRGVAAAYKLLLFTAALARIAVAPAALLEPGDARRRHLELAALYARLARAVWRY